MTRQTEVQGAPKLHEQVRQSESLIIERIPFLHRIGFLAAASVLCSASFAPIGQFYLAWIGLVPWLVVVAHGSGTLLVADRATRGKITDPSRIAALQERLQRAALGTVG